MSYESLCKTAKFFEDRAGRARTHYKQQRLAAEAKKYRIRAEIQRKVAHSSKAPRAPLRQPETPS